MKKSFAIAAAMTGLIACFQSCQHPYCEDRVGGYIAFRNFDSSSLETVIVKQYTAGSNFTQLTDSATFRLSNASTPLQHSSEGVIWPYSGAWIQQGTETIIEISNVNAQFRFKDVTNTREKSKYTANGSGSDSKICYNALASYNLNGTVVATGKHVTYGDPHTLEIEIHP